MLQFIVFLFFSLFDCIFGYNFYQEDTFTVPYTAESSNITIHTSESFIPNKEYFLKESPPIQQIVLQTDSNVVDNTMELQYNEKNLQDSVIQTRYLTGDIDLLSHDALLSVKMISDQIYNKTKLQLYIHIVKQPILDSDNSLDKDFPKITESSLIHDSPQKKYQKRREYEQQFISHLDGDYAVIFLFYNDHAITIQSNKDFIKNEKLLEEYAYPYLPAEALDSVKYRDGVNEGLSNLYLALAHTIAEYYNVELDAPKPMERPSEATKVIIYIMLFIMIGLFVLVSNGFFTKLKKGG
ncbi:hypothetical protein CQA53_02060 [Helicobacter didelphidarum]|uniref:TPM domain-containing protein n=1 Tax=Helicobacter didelphidarum TaxID=2040648 RepID=A0A3D8IQ85_9HELI|nr:hypothetical protein [Helicobacter didelphidarum]RDU67066.1 hypothetical protein CQA53_02060 [Helicobacter didelphidarum]